MCTATDDTHTAEAITFLPWTVDDAEALTDTELRDAVLALAPVRAALDAAEAALLGAFDQRGLYVADGALNARSWLALHTRVHRVVAGARVRLAKRLRRMPLMAAALAAGEVTDGHARALARCLTPRTLEAFAAGEGDLVDQAKDQSADEFDRTVTRWLAEHDPDGPEPDGGDPSSLHASRTFGSRVRVDADLDTEDGAEFLAELEELYDQLRRAEFAERDDRAMRSPAERNAAALLEMARRSSSTHGPRPATDPDDDDTGPGGRPRRPQLLVTAPVEALAGVPGALASLDDGTLIGSSVLMCWLCDSSLARVIFDADRIPIEVSRITYVPSDGQRRALIARDGGCIVPGCGRKPRWCEAHHVDPFPHGATSLDNLVLVCHRHHKLIHAGQIVLKLDPTGNHWIAHRPDGTPIAVRPPPDSAVA